MVGRIMAPKGNHILTLRTCHCVLLHGKRELRLQLQVIRIPENGRLSWIIWIQCNHKCYQNPQKGREERDEEQRNGIMREFLAIADFEDGRRSQVK